MNNISIHRLFKEIDVRVTYNRLGFVRDGEFYEIGKYMAENGKMTACLLIKKDTDISKACIEFLQNYCRKGKLHVDTKNSIEQFVKKIKFDNKYKSEFIFKMFDEDRKGKTEMNQIAMKFPEEQEKLDTNNDNKFKFMPRNHDKKIVHEFIVEAKIEDKSPLSICEKYNIPRGTVHSWYKDGTDLRILYSMYSESKDYVLEVLGKYRWDQIENYHQQLIDVISSSNNIDLVIKKQFIEMIVSIRKSDFIKPRFESKVYRNMYPTFDSFKQMAELQRERVLEIIYNDTEMLSIVIDQILNIR